MTSTITVAGRKCLNWRGWLQGLAGGVISGAASSVIAYFSLAGAEAADLAKAIDFKQAGAIFLSGAFIHAMFYLQKQPLPQAAATDTPFPKNSP